MSKAQEGETQKEGQNADDPAVRSLCRRCHVRITLSTFPILSRRCAGPSRRNLRQVGSS